MREVKYKLVKVLVPHCPECDEELIGDNSGRSPYECSCGIWESDHRTPTKFKIKPLKE